jgi:hypothetical protein
VRLYRLAADQGRNDDQSDQQNHAAHRGAPPEGCGF